jgi:hypothetical protein
MLSEESFAMFRVAEGFRASRTRGGKGACQISCPEAYSQIGARMNSETNPSRKAFAGHWPFQAKLINPVFINS